MIKGIKENISGKGMKEGDWLRVLRSRRSKGHGRSRLGKDTEGRRLGKGKEQKG